MANVLGQGQIQVGPSHQARLPAYQPDVRPSDILEQCASFETLVWLPEAITDGDLLMFLRAARSMAAFVGWCDGGSTDDGCAAASMDETTVNALHLLHQNDYDTGKALQALVKVINPKSIDKRWSDDDAKKFVRGLKQHGKNFFKIRRDLLFGKDTAQLVEYYYLWKKTPAASATRPHRRHRRPIMRRQVMAPNQPANEEMDEVSSVSEVSDNETDDDGEPMSTNVCSECHTSNSLAWYERSADGRTVCANCVRKYSGAVSIVSVEPADGNVEPPPFMFRPVKEEPDWKHGSPKPDAEDGRYDADSASSHEKPVQNGSEQRTSPSVDSSCSSSAVSPPELTKDGGTSEPPKSSSSPYDLCTEVSAAFPAEDAEIHNNPMDLETKNILLDYTSETLGQQATDAVISKHEMLVDDLQCLDAQDGKFTNDVYKRHGLTESVAVSAHRMPWYSYEQLDSFGTMKVAFGMNSDQTDDRIYPIVKTEKEESVDRRMESGVDRRMECGDSGERWPVEQFTSAVAGSDNVNTQFDVRPLRAVASVAPTQFTSLAAEFPDDSRGSTSDVNTPTSHFPPPLVPLPSSPSSTSHILAPSMPFSGSVLNASRLEGRGILAGSPRSEARSFVGGEDVSESEPEPDDGHFSPPPERINVEDHRSRNAIFMRRWKRGLSGCSRTDLEFVPVVRPRQYDERLMSTTSTVKSCQSSIMSTSGQCIRPAVSLSGASSASAVRDCRRLDMAKPRSGDYIEKKASSSVGENRSSDAHITSSLMSGTQHLPMFGPVDRGTPRGPISLGHDPTPALRQLSEYARPHIGVANSSSVSSTGRDPTRGMSYGVPALPPGHAMDPFLRMPGVFPPGSREALELEAKRDKREREAWERELRDMRELELMEKMKHEMELKLPGFDRLGASAAAAAGHLDPMWLAEIQRRYVTSGGPPPPSSHIPGVYPSHPTNLPPDFLQRERERIEMARSSQEQQQIAAVMAARDNSALYQIYQRYAHDPAMLQHQLSAYLAMSASKTHDSEVARMMDASHLVYHFARADPMSAGGASGGQGVSAAPPTPLPSHALPPPTAAAGNPLLTAAREQERVYMELLSRPPYNSDPVLTQQLMLQVAASQQEAIQRQLAMERECLGVPPQGPPMMH